ncbi:MAG: hypothetical protein H0U95_17160 [Bacteroidetes bacterium]|nr:hypothetical protein [Bacteroidota bacterium]
MNRLLFFVVFSLTFAVSNAQDKIKLKTGDIIKSRVLKVSGTEITYYKIFKLKDPKLKLKKADVEYIQYENGKIVYMSGKNPTMKPKKSGTTKKPVVKKKK